MSTNPFGLLDDPILAEPADTPAIPVTTAPVVATPTKTYPELAPQRGKRHNNSDTPKTTTNKPASTSEHAPNRLVYSREWLLTCYKNYAAPSGFTSSSSAFHELSQLPVALLPHTHEMDENDERGYGYHKGRGGRQQQGHGGQMNDRNNRGLDRGNNERGGGRMERNGPGGRNAAQGGATYQSRGQNYGNDHQQSQSQHERRGGGYGAERQRESARDAHLAKFDDKPSGDQSWLFEGGDDALEGSLDDVAGRLGITTDETPSGVPGSTFEAYEQQSRSNHHNQGQGANVRASTDDWRAKKTFGGSGLASASSASNPHATHATQAAARQHGLTTSEEVAKPRAARHSIQATSAAPAAVPSATNPSAAPTSTSPTPAATLDALWWYIDSKNVVQGPFTGSKMNSWLNFFTPDLSVANSPNGPWTPIAERIVKGINPFDGLSISSSPHTEFKEKFAEYSRRFAQLHNNTAQKAPQTAPAAQQNHEASTAFAAPAQPSHTAHHNAQPMLSHSQQMMMQQMMQQQAQQPTHLQAANPPTPVKGNALRLDDLFGSAGSMMDASAAANVSGAQAMQSGHHLPHHGGIWAGSNASQTTNTPSFRQIQEQEAIARAATASGQAHFSSQPQGHGVQPHGHQTNERQVSQPHQAGHAGQTQGKLADTQSLFALHFGSGSAPAPAHTNAHATTESTSEKASVAAAATSHGEKNTSSAVGASGASASASSNVTSTLSALPTLSEAAAAPRPGAAKTSLNDLFDSARVGRSVPPAVVVPKGPGMYEIQQEEMRRAEAEKVAEAQRKEEAKKAAEAQRGTWAESTAKPTPVAKPATKATKGASMREIQEEQERELASQRQRQVEQRVVAAAAAPRAPTFNGAWGAGGAGATGSSTKSLKQILEEEANAAAVTATASSAASNEARATAAVQQAQKKTSWAATVAPSTTSLRQIASEQQQQQQPASPAAKAAPAPAEDGDNFWDYPAEKAAPPSPAKVPVGGIPKAAAKKKGQKKVLNI